MKTNKILVGVNGAVLTTASGAKVKAVYPAGKGQNTSYLLLTDGKLANMKGARVNGVSVARYFTEQGFALAAPGNADAENLADKVDVLEGNSLVSKRSCEHAQELSRQLGGQQCIYVPFAADKPIVPVTVEEPRGFSTTAIEFGQTFASGGVALEYDPAVSRVCGSTAKLSAGWLVGPEGRAAEMPRNTEYGGIVEHAVFVICSSGVGRLLGAKNLEMDEDAPLDERYPRGKLVIGLENGDTVVVGIDAGDELGVDYMRDDAVLYSRQGFQGNGTDALKLGPVIGAIAAVIIRVQEMDATPKKASRGRAKVAA